MNFEPREPPKTQTESSPARDNPARPGFADQLNNAHHKFANIAFLQIGNQAGADCFMGASLPLSTISGPTDFVYTSASKEFFLNIGATYETNPELINAQKMKERLLPLSKYVGCVAGVPLPARGGDFRGLAAAIRIHHDTKLDCQANMSTLKPVN